MNLLKKIVFIVLVLLANNLFAGKQPKYIFYIIGDGMSIHAVEATNYYLSKDIKDVKNHLLMTRFPYSGYATTYSASHYITCSSAGGTALATGHKTNNNSIGIDPDAKPLNSIMSFLQDKGYRTGLITTDGINDATPASFYAHHYRKERKEIALAAAESGVDFLGGGTILLPSSDKKGLKEVLKKFKKNGYDILKGGDAYQPNTNNDRILMLPEELYPVSLPYIIDHQEGVMQLSDLSHAAIDFLYKKSDKGFFLMIENGQTDHASHVNDLGAVVREVINLDKNIEIAYQFYLEHPDETLIVVTSDHETGGMGLGIQYTHLNVHAVKHQKISLYELSKTIKALRESKASVSWEDIAALFKDKLGFWDPLKISKKQEERMKAVFEETFIKLNVQTVNTLYAKDDPLAVEAVAVLNEIAEVGWTTNSHTGGVVPLFAIGVGAEKFMGRMNNIDIPRKMIELFE